MIPTRAITLLVINVCCSTPGKDWVVAVIRYSERWRVHVEKYLNTTKTPTLVVKYENLLTDLQTELKRMMRFMEFPYTKDDLQCISKSTLEGFHRKHKNNTDPYTPEQRKIVYTQIRLANNVLLHYNISY